MTPLTFVLLVLSVFVLVCCGLILRAFFRVHDEPVIIPPEGREQIAIQGEGPTTSAPGGLPGARSDQPAGRNDRGQPAAAPLDRSALNLLKNWYKGRECAVCRREIGPVHASEPRPGLLNVASGGREILSWDDIPADHLQAILDSHLPVCASCNLAESFRRKFPERVTDRADSTERGRRITE